jgi:DNA-binding CsgD family transcriptional regulator
MLQDHLDEIAGSHSLDAVRNALVKALSNERVSVFNYGAGRISMAAGTVVERYWTTMDPAWLTRYTARGYQKTDRLVTAAITNIQPFFFEDVFNTPPLLPEQIEMETMFPYRRGFVVPMHSPFGRFGILSAVSDVPEEEWRERRYEMIARISLLGHTAHQVAEGLAGNAKTVLSEREQMVLKWSALGKTSDEIAALLGVTERTVRKHIASCMDKLGAASRVQAVSQALLAGLVKL